MPKVLYVENHESERRLMKVLKLSGYKVDVASNGEEGVKKAQEWYPDVILMDIFLPGKIDSVEAICQLRKNPDTATIPIIVIVFIVQMLERCGHYKIDVVSSEEERVKRAQEWYPGVILRDTFPPGNIDSVEAIRQLRKNPDTATIPIIVINASADAHFTKPSDFVELIAAINRFLITKILYVEDHEAERILMVQLLELYGYEADVASNGEEGVKKAQKWHPDVILMDIFLPGKIDGVEAIRQLHNNPDTKNIPIIAITAYGSARQRSRAVDAGADAYFTKTRDFDELMATINRLRKAPY